jgi:hypothetical protein
MKTLKQEEIYCSSYADFTQLSLHLEAFIDNYYNRLRLHSALGYRTPEEFEQDAVNAATAAGNPPDAATIRMFNPKKEEASIGGSPNPIRIVEGLTAHPEPRQTG